MTKNFADEMICGTYMLTISDNKVTISTLVGQYSTTAFCHPDDKFDIGEGVKECFNKLLKTKNCFGKNEKVVVKNNGLIYPVWEEKVVEFAKRNPEEHDKILLKWSKHDLMLNGAVCRFVDSMVTVKSNGDKMLIALVQNLDTDQYFVVDNRAIKSC